MNLNEKEVARDLAGLDAEADLLLSLQSLESEADQGLVQMFSSSSCVYQSCWGS